MGVHCTHAHKCTCIHIYVYIHVCVCTFCNVFQSASCSVLQCVAVCCSVLQCVAVCCSVLQCVTVCFRCIHISFPRYVHFQFFFFLSFPTQVYKHFASGHDWGLHTPCPPDSSPFPPPQIIFLFVILLFFSPKCMSLWGVSTLGVFISPAPRIILFSVPPVQFFFLFFVPQVYEHFGSGHAWSLYPDAFPLLHQVCVLSNLRLFVEGKRGVFNPDVLPLLHQI